MATTTDRDMRDQVALVLGSDADDFNIDGIVSDLIALENGAKDVGEIDVNLFWSTVIANMR